VSRASHAIDRIRVSFDDPNLVANAGLLLSARWSCVSRLERLVNATVRLPGRVGGAHRAARCSPWCTAQVLPFRVMAPSTLGTFLRAFTFGHVRQLEAVVGEALRRAWHGRHPGLGPAGDRHRLDHL
jgi:hypothetical protein